MGCVVQFGEIAHKTVHFWQWRMNTGQSSQVEPSWWSYCCWFSQVSVIIPPQENVQVHSWIASMVWFLLFWFSHSLAILYGEIIVLVFPCFSDHWRQQKTSAATSRKCVSPVRKNSDCWPHATRTSWRKYRNCRRNFRSALCVYRRGGGIESVVGVVCLCPSVCVQCIQVYFVKWVLFFGKWLWCSRGGGAGWMGRGVGMWLYASVWRGCEGRGGDVMQCALSHSI